ncbi:MAG: hypothetical protein KAH03_00505 [Cocleimonas sp.]|nr:hypothetical protein [Cocleimonas sp.]
MTFLNYSLLGVFLLSASNTAFSDQRFSCNTSGLKNAEPFIENLIDRILTIGNIRQHYNVCSVAKYSNASAMIYQNKRIIAYDPVFLNRLSRRAGEPHWGKVTALAHEIGHHLQGHTDKLDDLQRLPKMKRLAIQRQYELEADQFAGKVLAHMGAALSSTQALIRTLKVHQNVTLSDHPNAKKRVIAVTRGWSIGCQQVGRDCNSKKYKGNRSQGVIVSPMGRKETPHYSRFMQQAENLKGVIVNRAYCNLYASLAVQQTTRSLQYQCGFNVDSYASPWSRAYSPQSDWCMKGSAHATSKEAKFRETKLASCVSRKQKKSNQQAIHSPLGRKATANYVNFMRQAKKLKGIRVNRNYCNLYASLAVQQTRRNQQHQCGFDIGDRANQWSPLWKAQANWCMTTRVAVTSNEAKFRETKLASCIR